MSRRQVVVEVICLLMFMAMLFVLSLGVTRLVRQTALFSTPFEIADRFVQECIASERYTRDECITMVGKRDDQP